GLRPVGTAGADPESPVGAEAKKLGVFDELLSLVTQVVRDDARHLVEEELAGYAAEEGEGLLQAADEDPHVLLGEELHPEESGIAEHDEQDEALPPREAHLGEIDLRLMTRLGLEADNRLRVGPRPRLANEDLDLREASLVAGRLHLVEEPNGGELRIGLKTDANDLLVRVELARLRRPAILPRQEPRLRVRQELACGFPAVDRTAIDSQLPRNGRDG